MLGSSSTGAFSTHRSNQMMLNSKRAKGFLLNDTLLRFKGRNRRLENNGESSVKPEVNKWIAESNSRDKEKQVLVLVISVLTVLLGLAVI